jgi:hypothetical protein
MTRNRIGLCVNAAVLSVNLGVSWFAPSWFAELLCALGGFVLGMYFERCYPDMADGLAKRR